MVFHDRRKFASFFFKWSLDRNTRLIFSIIFDISGRNIKPYGRSLMHYPRWVEAGYLFELMRLTDFINSLPIYKREKMKRLAYLGLMRPSESLINDLWNLAKGYLSFEDFYRKYRMQKS